jgi:hypothetical protein
MDSAAVDHKKIAFDRHAVQLILNGIFYFGVGRFLLPGATKDMLKAMPPFVYQGK